MIADYIVYFSTLLREEQYEHLFIIFIFLFVLIGVCFLLGFLKLKFIDESKNTIFQRFLRKI